jgi:hypothetical protein
MQYGERRGEKGKRRSDDLVSRADTGRSDGHVQRGRPAIAAQTVFGPGVLGEFFLECPDFGRVRAGQDARV